MDLMRIGDRLVSDTGDKACEPQAIAKAADKQ